METLEDYFETVKCHDDKVFHVEYHNRRIARTIFKKINLYDYINPPSNKLLKCKVIYNRLGIKNVVFSEYSKKDIKSFKLVYDNHIDYSYKEVDRENINLLFSTRGSADEIIIIKNSLVTDTSIANLAILYNNQWLTPKTPLLNGTTRERLLDEKKLVEADISVEILFQAKKVAMLNAMVDMDIIENYRFYN